MSHADVTVYLLQLSSELQSECPTLYDIVTCCYLCIPLLPGIHRKISNMWCLSLLSGIILCQIDYWTFK